MKFFSKFSSLFSIISNNRGSLSLAGGGGDGGAGAGAAGTTPPGDGGGNNPAPNGNADPAGTINPSGGEPAGAVDFPEGLEEAIKSDPSLKVFIKDNKLNYANLIKSYVSTKQKMGEKGLILPKETSSKEEWEQFYNSLRDPDLQKYELKAEKDKINPEIFEGFKKTAHSLGLTTKQAQELFNWYSGTTDGLIQNQTKAQQEAYEAEAAKLKSDWGEATQHEMTIAVRAFKEFATPEEIQAIVAKGLDKDIGLIRLFNKIGKALNTEDQFKGEASSNFRKTKEQAQAEMNKIYADSKHAYWDKNHASHADAVKEMQKFTEIVTRG